ncbi:MAG: ATP-binding protein, partial [Acidimicrobiales bacterium]
MHKRHNPYTPGAGRKPRTLAGRDREVEGFESLVERLGAGSYERSLIYTGLRGVGKTVLLMEFDVLASESGWATTDVQEVGSQPDFRVTFARMAARLLTNMSRRHRARDRIERALSVVKAFSVAVPGAVELRLDVEAARGVADSGDPEQDLVELIKEIGQVAAANQMGALFLIDEMQNLDALSLAAICIAFQSVSREGLPVAMVAAALPDLRVRMWSAKPYADRLFSYGELGGLAESAAHAALTGPAAAAGIEFEAGVADRIVAEAAGYPYFLQEYGQELWNYAERTPITMADLDAVRDLVRDNLAHSFFGTRFELGTETEQRYR